MDVAVFRYFFLHTLASEITLLRKKRRLLTNISTGKNNFLQNFGYENLYHRTVGRDQEDIMKSEASKFTAMGSVSYIPPHILADRRREEPRKEEEGS